MGYRHYVFVLFLLYRQVHDVRKKERKSFSWVVGVAGKLAWSVRLRLDLFWPGADPHQNCIF